jgi:hypothetical protein
MIIGGSVPLMLCGWLVWFPDASFTVTVYP